MKIIDKKGETNFSQWIKMAKAAMVLVDGAVRVLGANACTAQTYSPTWTNARVRRNRSNGGGIGFGAISEDLWEANAYVLFMCSFYNVS
jgi:hypothetical protein